MAQAKALDALEPFLALSKSAISSRAAADLVSRATSHPNTFVFAELLQTPQVQALANADAEYAAYLVLLKIFSYGTYADYERGSISSSSSSTKSQTNTLSQPPPPITASHVSLPSLNDVQDRKLRQLSLVSLATDRASLSYTHLIKELRLADARELETLVVSAIYAGLVSATLDPAHGVVRIGSVSPLRDLAPGAIPQLHKTLQGWSGRCETTLADIDSQVAAIKKAAAVRAMEKRQWDAQFNQALEDEKNASAMSIGGDHAGKKSGIGRMKQRYTKRGSNLMMEAAAGYSAAASGSGGLADDNEYMDVDDNESSGVEANKRAHRQM